MPAPDPQAPERRRDLTGAALGGVVVLVGAFLLLQTRGMSAMGSVFPRTIASIMVVAAAVLMVASLLRAPSADEAEGSSGGSTARRVGVVVVMAVWVLVFPTLGFVTSGVLAFLAILAIANHDGWELRRAAAYVAIAVGVVAGAWLLLTAVLNLPVPRGFLI